jgi:hypothetical protein
MLPVRKSARSKPVTFEPFLLGAEAEPDDGAWYVYLFALTDCSAFKIGFTCNPLQRITTFSRRYFERFELRQSQLLNVHTNDDARALEAALKTALAPHRMAAPEWIPAEAGGQTEWFSAVYFGDAEERMRASNALRTLSQPISAFEHFHGILGRTTDAFERWAATQAQLVCELREAAVRGYAVRDHGASLRDWLDAYGHFDLPLYAQSPDTLEFVKQAAYSRG